MATFGYARVSTDIQNVDLQINALLKAGCKLEHIYKDVGFTGRNVERPGLKKVLSILKPGDTIMVWKLDRLGRSIVDLVVMLNKLRKREISFQSITEGWDQATIMGQAMTNILCIFAEVESHNIRERVNAGLVAARERGVKLGRPVVVNMTQRATLLEAIERLGSVSKAARFMKISRSNAYNILATERKTTSTENRPTVKRREVKITHPPQVTVAVPTPVAVVIHPEPILVAVPTPVVSTVLFSLEASPITNTKTRSVFHTQRVNYKEKQGLLFG